MLANRPAGGDQPELQAVSGIGGATFGETSSWTEKRRAVTAEGEIRTGFGPPESLTRRCSRRRENSCGTVQNNADGHRSCGAANHPKRPSSARQTRDLSVTLLDGFR